MRRRSWIQIFTDLGAAILEVVRAEAALLQEEWRRWGDKVRAAALILGAVVFVLFWTMPLALFATVLLVAKLLDLGLLAASWLVVGLVAVVVAVALAVVRFRYLRDLESPVESVRRRFADHGRWWRTEILPGERRLGEGEAPREETADE